jgi:hypothetical protein
VPVLKALNSRVGQNPGFFEKTQWTRVFSRKPQKTHLELGFFRKKVGFYRGNLGIF